MSLEQMLARGDREGVVTTFIKEVIKMPPHEFEQYHKLPAWPARVAAAHTLPRGMRAVEEFKFDPERYKKLEYPTLILEGGDSPDFMKAADRAVDRALPNSRIVVMPGQQHIAIDTAPDLFVREVVTFLDEKVQQ